MKRSNKLLMGLFIFILAGMTALFLVAMLYSNKTAAADQPSVTSEASVILK
jgi:cell division protein FtsL